MKIARISFLALLFFVACNKSIEENEVEIYHDIQIDIIPDYQRGNVILVTSSPEQIDRGIVLTYVLPDKFNSSDHETPGKIESEKVKWFPLSTGSHKDTLFVYQYLFSQGKDTIVIASSHIDRVSESFDIGLLARPLDLEDEKVKVKINFYYKPFILDLKGAFYPNALDSSKDSSIAFFQNSINNTSKSKRWPLAYEYYSDFIELDPDSTMSKVSISYNIPKNMNFHKYYNTYENNKADSIMLKGLKNMEANKTLKKDDFKLKKRQYDTIHIIILSFASATLFMIFLIKVLKFRIRIQNKKTFSNQRVGSKNSNFDDI